LWKSRSLRATTGDVLRGATLLFDQSVVTIQGGGDLRRVWLPALMKFEWK
jgi:hypothetical protein